MYDSLVIMEDLDGMEDITDELDRFDINTHHLPKIARKINSSPNLFNNKYLHESRTYCHEEWQIIRQTHSESELRENWGMIRGVKSLDKIPRLIPETKLKTQSDQYFQN